MKRFISWVKSPKSDFALLILALILLNLVSIRAFVRIDMTGNNAFSLSEPSRQVVRTLEEPLSVKVFFSSNLPAPYNSVEQYLRDLLIEYKGASNKNFQYEFFDMEKPENQDAARSYNLRQIQVQEVKDNEVGVKNAYMGIALLYSDRIEIMDSITSADSLEYRLTTAFSKMIADTATLAGIIGNVDVSLYVTRRLVDFNIGNFTKLDSAVQNAVNAVNRKNNNHLVYASYDPAPTDIDRLASEYGLQTINWQDDDGTEGKGVLGLVVSYGDSSRLVPLQLARGFFGGYSIAGLDRLEDSLQESLQSLVAKSPKVAYLEGHGEQSLNDTQNGAGRWSNLCSDWYEFVPVNLAENDIPANVSCLIINGPKTVISEIELYKIDQFLMAGGNIAVFLDPFNEIQPENQNPYQQMPLEYVLNVTGLERLLAKYGVTVNGNYVCDRECYSVNQKGYGQMQVNFIPIAQKENISKSHPITKNLAYLLFVQNGSLALSANPDAVTVTELAKTSDKSWCMSDNIVLSPMYIQEPPEDTMKQETLAAVLEGTFDSAFDHAVEAPAKNEEPDTMVTEEQSSSVSMTAASHLTKSVRPGKVFVAGSSVITTAQVIDETGTQPIAMFVRNVVDYMNNNSELCLMRTKGLNWNILDKTPFVSAKMAKLINQYGVPLIVVIAGLIVLRCRIRRRRTIQQWYLPDDSRDAFYDKKREEK